MEDQARVRCLIVNLIFATLSESDLYHEMIPGTSGPARCQQIRDPPFPDVGDMTSLYLVSRATLGLMVYIITMMDDGTDQSEAGAGGQ